MIVFVGIYSMIDESFPEFRVYREEDLCKVVTLNIGKSYTRWMGMIKESLGTECVIITTASGNKLLNLTQYLI